MTENASNVTPGMRVLMGWFGRVVATAAPFAAFGYFVAWQYTRAYYNALGCRWALDRLGTFNLVSSASSFLLAIVLPAIATVFLVSAGTKSRTLTRIFNFLLILSVLLFIADFLPGRWLPRSMHLALAATYLNNAAFGLATAQIIIDVSRSGFGLHPADIRLGVWILFVLTITAPLTAGTQQGLIDVNPETSALPFIQRCAPSDHNWRLIEESADRALVMKFVPGKSPQFRVIAVTDGWYVSSTALSADAMSCGS